MQWSNHILDNYVAPKLSELNKCFPPEVAELPKYAESLTLNQIFSSTRYKDSTKVVFSSFISRLRLGTEEYRHGRESLLKYESLPDHSHLQFHRIALSKFENCVLQTYLSIACLNSLHHIIPELQPVFRKGDNSDYDRLRLLSNRIKHFDEDIVEAARLNITPPISPVWITNSGLDCTNASITFDELASILKSQAEDAKYFGEDFFKERNKTN